VAQTDESSAGRVGVGVPTITTFKGQAGTAILWIADVDGGLRAYRAVPESMLLDIGLRGLEANLLRFKMAR